MFVFEVTSSFVKGIRNIIVGERPFTCEKISRLYYVAQVRLFTIGMFGSRSLWIYSWTDYQAFWDGSDFIRILQLDSVIFRSSFSRSSKMDLCSFWFTSSLKACWAANVYAFADGLVTVDMFGVSSSGSLKWLSWLVLLFMTTNVRGMIR